MPSDTQIRPVVLFVVSCLEGGIPMRKYAPPLMCLLVAGCAGIRYTEDQKTFVAHGESFHVFS